MIIILYEQILFGYCIIVLVRYNIVNEQKFVFFCNISEIKLYNIMKTIKTKIKK